MGKYVELTDNNFDEVVLTGNKPVLVDFWADWCGPCRMFAPTVSELAEDFDGKAVIAKVNVDQCPDTSSKYGVMSIPTVLVFKNGNQVEKTVGVQSKAKLAELIEKHI